MRFHGNFPKVETPNSGCPEAPQADCCEVREQDLERQLASLAGGVSDPAAGLFGPDSVTWRIEREAALFLAAGRALLLQLAHPWVAAAIVGHSRTLADPIGRFHRTFSVMYTMVFGSVDQALAAARTLYRRHAGIRGTLPEAAGPFPAGSEYLANHLPALRWVHATLIDSAALAHDLILPPLTPGDLDRFALESHRLAGLFGIPGAYLPQDWRSFRIYFDHMVESDTLTVTDAARLLAGRLLFAARLPVPIPAFLKSLSAHLLPAGLRQGYRLAHGEAEVAAAQRVLARIRRIYPLLPARLRHVGPYIEARDRLCGRTPALSTRLSNRLWIGKPLLGSG